MVRSLAAAFAVLAVTLALGVYVGVLRPSLAAVTVAAVVAGVAALAHAASAGRHRVLARDRRPGGDRARGGRDGGAARGWPGRRGRWGWPG